MCSDKKGKSVPNTKEHTLALSNRFINIETNKCLPECVELKEYLAFMIAILQILSLFSVVWYALQIIWCTPNRLRDCVELWSLGGDGTVLGTEDYGHSQVKMKAIYGESWSQGIISINHFTEVISSSYFS